MTELIQIQNSNGDVWSPFVGEETTRLLKSKGFETPNGILSEAGERILHDTYRIMQACCNPNGVGDTETGIVIGYVQSGKTLSFTVLTALARDNGFQLVIVIAGTSVNLVNQSTDRLKRDLRLDTRYDRKWALIMNPSAVEDRETIETALEQWADPTFLKERCKTILITVMKNGSHLRNLTNLIKDLRFDRVPILIIDDEGDQASLNTRARHAAKEGIPIDEIISEGEVSTIYRRLTDLRVLFPLHTFLQYTATPQANLFINIMDRLSPNFIKLLRPGGEYAGGTQFFRESPNLVEEIPIGDIPAPGNSIAEPPDSLLRALQLFYLGVAAGEILRDQHNRSMLIHPSRLQEGHSTYFNWANAIRDSWKRRLTGSDAEDKKSLLAEFHLAYNDLELTAESSLPAFDTLSAYDLVHAIQYTPIVEVNARRGKTPHISWQDTYSWILVGGQSMDRGFTVEGLTVTYMPRDLGLANVDTILQRARFFGYKRSYLGYCRVFLPQVTIDAFRAIIEHEEDVRARLLDIDRENRSLNSWQREAVLDQMLNLTRPNVLYDLVDRDRFGDEWVRINAPHDTEALIASNLAAALEFLRLREDLFHDDPGHPKRTLPQRHLVAELSLRDCLDHLLNKLKYTRDSDSAAYSGLRGLFKQHIVSFPRETCQLYIMSARGIDPWVARERSLDKNDQILNLFQGRNPKNGEAIYPGDAEIMVRDQVSIQVHLLDILDNKQICHSRVPTLAIWVPERIGKDIVRQG